MLSKKWVNKSDIIKELARKKQISIRLATLAFDTFFQEIITSLKNEKRIEIRNFGSFELRKYKPYRGRNPKNNKSVQVKAKKVPFFKIGILKNKLNS